MTSIQCAKLAMSPDAFLYACIQSDEARRKKDGDFQSHLRYEPFLFKTYRAPQARTLEAFANDLHAILQHHWAANPQFRRGETIDMETLAYFSQAVPTVFADIEDLVRLFFGRPLPQLVRLDDPAAISDDFPALEKAIERFQKYNETLTEESAAYQPSEGLDDAAAELCNFSTELWYVVVELSREIFGDYTGALLGFVNWKFAPKEVAEAIDWRVTPPVGAAYIKWRKSLDPDFGKPPHLRRGNRDDKREGRGEKREGRDEAESPGVSAKQRPRVDAGVEISLEAPKPQREHVAAPEHAAPSEGAAKPDHTAKDHAHKRPERERGAKRPEREHGSRQFSGEKKFDKRDAGDRGGRRFRDEAPRQSSEEQVEVGLAEARSAMEALKADISIAEIPLAPANSFIRRAQHALIVEMGFNTESRGEGRERCVHVMRS